MGRPLFLKFRLPGDSILDMTKKYVMHGFSNATWDREWHQPFHGHSRRGDSLSAPTALCVSLHRLNRYCQSGVSSANTSHEH